MPAQSEPVTEAKLAWLIWQALQILSTRLWERYEKDFLSFDKQNQIVTEDDDFPPDS